MSAAENKPGTANGAQSSPPDPHRPDRRTTVAVLLLVLAALIGLAALFGSTAFAGGDDWETFHGAAWRVLRGQPLYGTRVTHAFFSNPPWVAIALVPLALLPPRWGWGMLVGLGFLAVGILARRYTVGRWKILFLLLSPPIFYSTLHGQIDPVVLAMALLPREWWALAALTKPQVAIAWLFGIPRRRWPVAGLVLVAFIGVSLLVFGNWPARLLAQPTPFVDSAHNLWAGLWPFQIPAGLALVLISLRRDDERFLFAASPFLSPYAATSTLLGPWLAVTSWLSDWEVGLLWLSWWGTVIYRLVA
jgi:hypothetical protein